MNSGRRIRLPGRYGETMKSIWNKKVVLITGANGFLGSHLVSRALTYKAEVIALVKEDIPYSLFNLAGLNQQTKLIKADVRSKGPINSLFKNRHIDFCFHIAAQAIVGVANNSPLGTLETNIEGTWNILEAGRVFGVGALVVASSDKAYGEHKKLPYEEDTPLLASHPYDVSKACADILSRTFAHTYKMPIAVTRCANIYGPGDFNFTRIIPDAMQAVINDKDPVIRSDGSPLRDYIFIDDIVDAYFSLAEKLYSGKTGYGEAFNFGTGKPISVLGLVRKIIKISGKNYLKPVILGKGKIKGEIDRQYLSSRKAERILGWNSRISLDEGLKKTYRWYRAHLSSQ
jgi:CDP-glucose 4,6-dehydratase